MKIALISDIHFGVKKHSENVLNHQIDFFENLLIPTLKSNNINYLFILGDLFDNSEVTNILIKDKTVNLFNKLVETFPNLNIIILKGNHDIYYKNTLSVSSLNIFGFLNEHITVISQLDEITINKRKILLVPWLIKDSQYYNDFLNIVNSDKQYDLCFGHFAINKFEIIPSLVENKGFEIENFKNFKQVYSGHFHIRNKIENIQYLGSPYEITWNDYGNTKGITLLDLDTLEQTFIENTISPKHIKLYLSSVIKDKNILKDIKNNYVKFYFDTPLSTDKKLLFEDKIKQIKCLELSIIDNSYDVTVDDSNIDIKEDVQGSPIKFVYNWYDELKHPETIDLNELKLITDKIYNKALKQ
jgi:DNA repair exonuclease SbcCD nuclease subunit